MCRPVAMEPTRNASLAATENTAKVVSANARVVVRTRFPTLPSPLARPIVTKNLGGRGLIDIVELQAHAADNFGYK